MLPGGLSERREAKSVIAASMQEPCSLEPIDAAVETTGKATDVKDAGEWTLWIVGGIGLIVLAWPLKQQREHVNARHAPTLQVVKLYVPAAKQLEAKHDV